MEPQANLYRNVFEASPVPLAQIGLSGLRAALEALEDEQAGGIAAFLQERPGELTRLVALLEVERLNRAAVALYEADSEEELREGLFDLWLPETLPVLKAVVLGLVSGREVVEGEVTHRTHRGGRRHVRVAFHLPRRLSSREPLVVSVVDQTEQVRGQALLREIAQELGRTTGERYFEGVVRFLGRRLGADLALVGEADGELGSVHTLAAWRDGAPAADFTYALTGSPCEEVVGRRLCSYADDVCALFPEDRGLAELGARAYVGTPLFASDGKPLGVLAVAFRQPLRETHQVESTLRILASRASAEVERIRGEAQRLGLEEQLVRAQRLESVGRLAGGIAHDFNNLLSPIIAYTEMALDKVGEEDTLHGDLVEILRAAERAAGVTRRLLAFSRRQVLEIGPVNLNAVVEEMGRMIRAVIREDIQLDLRCAPDTADVQGDRGQIEQVLMNLVVNAQDAMPGGGRLTIATARVDRDEQGDDLPPGSYVCLEVRDTGCGMDEFTRAHMFEPFFTTKAAQGGSGLGLATVYGIVQQHGGAIHVDSAEDEGSVFRVCLPAAVGSRPVEPAPTRRERRPSGSERIMVVEDEAAVRRLVVTVLRRHGYDVLEASTPLQGLEMALDPDQELDMLVTDVVMPQMDGVELHRRITQQRPGLPVLYLSGYAHDVIAARGVTEVNLLEKPFSLRDLTDRVRQVLDR